MNQKIGYDSEKTAVIFRKWNLKNRREALCDIIALFPYIGAGNGHCNSYEHVGQHGGASYIGVISQTTPATPEEYKDLAEELTSFGYNLEIMQRRNRNRYVKGE